MAVPNTVFDVVAVCRVDGGPDYFVRIKSEASEVNYKIILPSKEKFLNLKEVSINSRVLQYFEIENTSKVTFEYSIRIDSSIRYSEFMKNFIKIIPSRGKINGGERAKIRLYIIPGIPDELFQILVIQVSHFEPEKIMIRGSTLFQTLRIGLERKIDYKLKKTIQNILKKKSKMNNNQFIMET